MDPSRSLAMMDDASLGQWFSRPIQVAEYTWNVDNPIFQRLNPWTLFWENDRNIEKIKNFHLLQAKLHVKILINGNGFYYGRAIAAYEPLSPLDDTSPSRTWLQQDFIRGSQRMKVFINPTNSSGGSLELPFFWPKNNITIGDNEWRDLGEIVIASLNDLKHANGSTDPLTITVMAWADDVKVAIPTRSVPESGKPKAKSTKGSKKADEHNQDIISRPASNVARVAGALSNVPVIGPYAKATQIGAKALASGAKMLGFSAPNELEQSIYEPRAKHSLAVTDTKQSANKVTMDSKQELTIDPTTTGIRADDELPIASIAGRESYITTFQWPLSSATGTHLWNVRVDPGLKGRNGDEWHFPASALAALPFEYWRGTMRFRFQIVASEYHKGRLRFSYDPNVGGAAPEFNTQYTTIHDIASSKDFTIDVGWAQDTPYRQALAWYGAPEWDTTPIITDFERGNGILTVNVLNKLSAPSADTSDISINVFISMLDDFEVAVPSDNPSYIKFLPPVAVPESGTPNDEEADEDDQAAPVTDPEVLDTYGETQIDTPDTTLVFMGEAITSFRTLLKRAYKAELRLLPEVPGVGMFKFSRGSFPTYGGFITGSVQANSMVQDFFDGRRYNTTTTTLLNYLGRAYLGWRGSTRWTVDCGSLNLAINSATSDTWGGISFGLSRTNFFNSTQQIVDVATTSITNVPQSFNEVSRGTDWKGLYLANTSVNPIQTIEVPYTMNKRFSYTFQADSYLVSTVDPGWECTMMVPSSATGDDYSFLSMYVSAGEDFNFFFFNGLPPVYLESNYGLDAGV